MNDSLAATEASSLTTRSEDWETIFQMFRIVFDALFCLHRKIYWVEKKWGNTVLREVAQLPRTSKKEDIIVATMPGSYDPDAVRLMIANRNRGQILTGIRWEIYGDFELEELLLSGRFDHLDLLMDISRAKLQSLADREIVTLDVHPLSWDFDGILLTHRCGHCGSQIEKHFLVFSPEFQTCRACSAKGDKPKSDSTALTIRHPVSSSVYSPTGHLTVAAQLLNRLRAVKHVHMVVERDSDSPHLLIDVHATPLFCWFFSSSEVMNGRPFIDLDDRALPGTGALNPAAMEDCYRMSVFPLLKQPIIRNAFMKRGLEFYSRHIAQVRVNDFRIPGLGTEERESWYRPCRIGEWAGEAYVFRDRTEVLSKLDAWMYGPGFPTSRKASDDWIEEQNLLIDAAKKFPSDMENQIEAAYFKLKEKS